MAFSGAAVRPTADANGVRNCGGSFRGATAYSAVRLRPRFWLLTLRGSPVGRLESCHILQRWLRVLTIPILGERADEKMVGDYIAKLV